jgi:HK97 family phage major capsid protein
MNVSGDFEGGYAVPSVLYDQMITVLRDSSPVRQLATVVTINSDALEILADRDEAQCAWVAENASRNETMHANLSKIRIPVHEMYAEPRISQKLLDDAVFDVEEWLLTKVAEKMGRTENTAFVSGDGSNRPRGFLAMPLGTGAGQIETVKTGVDGAWAVSNSSDALINLQATMKTSYLGEAVWMMNRNLLADVRKFKTTDGQYIW